MYGHQQTEETFHHRDLEINLAPKLKEKPGEGYAY